MAKLDMVATTVATKATNLAKRFIMTCFATLHKTKKTRLSSEFKRQS